LLTLLAALSLAAYRPPAPTITGSEKLAPGLATRLNQAVAASASTKWRTGLAVASCASESLLFGYNAAKPLTPASNQKLVVTACALEAWDDALVRHLDSLLRGTPSRKHRIANSPARADSHGLNARPDFPGYRHLVLANRESDNMEAEWMLHHLARRSGVSAQVMLSRFLERNGIPKYGLRVWDGCGLGRRNRVSPLTLGRLLARVHNSPRGDVFRSSLAVPLQPGTLIRRNLAVGPRLAAKTGYIRDVFALSGYLTGRTDTFAFSFIVNGCGSGARAYRFFDALLTALDGWDARQTAAATASSDSGGN
jgi:D-alanyl-D-alanine carboxypeptidase/D-alanyl-D-alanine-endopeptidase (penicillin-binding protein 4)